MDDSCIFCNLVKCECQRGQDFSPSEEKLMMELRKDQEVREALAGLEEEPEGQYYLIDLPTLWQSIVKYSWICHTCGMPNPTGRCCEGLCTPVGLGLSEDPAGFAMAGKYSRHKRWMKMKVLRFSDDIFIYCYFAKDAQYKRISKIKS